MPRGSFTVASLVDESDAVVSRFVAHHLRIGADPVTLYLDRPRDIVLEGCDENRVEIVPCDDHFWSTIGGRPPIASDRQPVVFDHARRRATADWIAAIDADEYLIADRPIGDLLAAIPELDAVTLPTAEAVWGPGDVPGSTFGATHFRTAMHWITWRVMKHVLYPRSHQLMRRGLCGHIAGKSITRVSGAAQTLGIHFPLDANGARVGARLEELDGLDHSVYLGHFDAIDEAHLRRKWQRKLGRENPHMHAVRRDQLDHYRSVVESPAAFATTFDRLYRLNRAQFTVLRGLDAGFTRDLWPQDGGARCSSSS